MNAYSDEAMKLENSLYRILHIRNTGSGFDAAVELYRDHPIYAGHFPGRAVVPGICTLSLVKDCLKKFLGGPVRLTGIKECKFVSALVPDHPLLLELGFEMKEDGFFRCRVFCEGRTVLKLKAAYAGNPWNRH